jgi:hypothetical protein
VIHANQVRPPMLDAILNLASEGVSLYILSTLKREHIQLTSLYPRSCFKNSQSWLLQDDSLHDQS